MFYIALTNDDGIKSPGLKAVAEAVQPLGEIVVIAPSRQQTSSGRSLAGKSDASFRAVNYKVNKTAVSAYHCDCTPARVVLHAFDVLLEKQPDLLISGCNYGENLGTNVTISGTVGAALQAAASGIPCLTVSLQTKVGDHFNHRKLDWTAAKHFIRFFAELMLKKKMPADVDILNVNIPAKADSQTPWKLTKLSRQPYFSNHIKNPKPESKISAAKCCYGFDINTLEPDSDIMAFTKGMVSVTPISMDLASRTNMKKLNTLLGGK